jgi:hypothetical protein
MQPMLLKAPAAPPPNKSTLQPILVELTQEQLLKEPVMQ